MAGTTCTVSGKTQRLDVIKENAKTVWVRLPDGKHIKRHRRKHQVREATEPPVMLKVFS